MSPLWMDKLNQHLKCGMKSSFDDEAITFYLTNMAASRVDGALATDKFITRGHYLSTFLYILRSRLKTTVINVAAGVPVYYGSWLPAHPDSGLGLGYCLSRSVI